MLAYFNELNKEEFIELFSQNINMIGRKGRVYVRLLFSAADTSLLTMQNQSLKVFMIPVQERFKVAMTQNERYLSAYVASGQVHMVRAFSGTFSKFPDLAAGRGYVMTELTLSRGNATVSNVMDDASLAEKMWLEASGDLARWPVKFGFTNTDCRIYVDNEMTFTLSNPDAGAAGLIFEMSAGVMGQSRVYEDAFRAFTPKRNDDEVAIVRPMKIAGRVKNVKSLSSALSSNFARECSFRPYPPYGIAFAGKSGERGSIIVEEGRVILNFQSETQLGFRIKLMDATERLIRND